MKKFKPFLLGSLAGAGLMFGSLNYHVVQSHDGLQIVPRTPQASLGLTYADIRQWDARQWSDRSELARALVAHGSSDLITQSVVDDVTRSVNEDGGTVERLRLLLNDSRESVSDDLDAPLFDLFDSDERETRSLDDGLAIPFPMESKKPSRNEAIAGDLPRRTQEDLDDNWNRSDASRGSLDLPDIAERSSRSTWASPLPPREEFRDPFTHTDLDDVLLWDDKPLGKPIEQPHLESAQEKRRREMESLEDSLFGDDDGGFNSVDDSAGAIDSVRRSLNSRAERVLERARSGLNDDVADASQRAFDATNGYVRDRMEDGTSGSLKPGSRSNVDDELSLWDDTFDPFLD